MLFPRVAVEAVVEVQTLIGATIPLGYDPDVGLGCSASVAFDPVS